MNILEMILVGGIGAAIANGLFKLIEKIIVWKMSRKAKTNDTLKKNSQNFEAKMADEIQTLKSELTNLKIGNKAVLRDRIKYLGSLYIKAKEINFYDREDLIDMHSVYHNNLDGNGNLDALMSDIMKLPLSEE